MPHEKPFTAMVMSIIAGSSTVASSIISVQNVDQAGTNILLVHIDSIFVGLATGFMVGSFDFAMFHAPAHSHIWGTLVLVLSIISIIFVRMNFVGAVLGSVAGLIALAFKLRYGAKPQPHDI
ncbi:MAG: hypothetical protein ACRD3Z_03425 [Nitrososphaerales archaeon]